VEKTIERGDTVFVLDCVDNPVVKKNFHYIQTDVSSVDSIKKAFKKIYSKTNSIDLLVNNAGIARDNIALRLKESDWDSVLDVNLKGAFFCAQQALTKMIRQEKSYIINISSVVGLTGNPGQVNYASSKAGIIAMTKTLAREYASRNVLVNAIAPGFIVTRLTDKLPDAIKEQAKNLIPLKRFGTPADVADLVLFLSSGNADYITGQVIKVDGGMVL
jgi:3-oxoacyl-[acyl-carrier protein] reductase